MPNAQSGVRQHAATTLCYRPQPVSRRFNQVAPELTFAVRVTAPIPAWKSRLRSAARDVPRRSRHSFGRVRVARCWLEPAAAGTVGPRVANRPA